MIKIKGICLGKQQRVSNLISTDEKLLITLQFLATSESYKSLRYRYRINDSAISLFLKPVCDAVFKQNVGFPLISKIFSKPYRFSFQKNDRKYID